MTTQIKSMLKKTMAIGLVAGAIALTGAVKAEAQQWAVGVQFGAPVYGYAPGYGPDYYGSDYYARNRYEHARREAFERRQAWLRQQEWIARQRHEAREREYRYDRDRDYRR